MSSDPEGQVGGPDITGQCPVDCGSAVSDKQCGGAPQLRSPLSGELYLGEQVIKGSVNLLDDILKMSDFKLPETILTEADRQFDQENSRIVKICLLKYKCFLIAFFTALNFIQGVFLIWLKRRAHGRFTDQ